jgi:hypothetical protein
VQSFTVYRNPLSFGLGGFPEPLLRLMCGVGGFRTLALMCLSGLGCLPESFFLYCLLGLLQLPLY